MTSINEDFLNAERVCFAFAMFCACLIRFRFRACSFSCTVPDSRAAQTISERKHGTHMEHVDYCEISCTSRSLIMPEIVLKCKIETPPAPEVNSTGILIDLYGNKYSIFNENREI